MSFSLPSSEEPVESLKLKKRLAFPSLNPFVESDDSSTNNSSMASISPSSSVETDPQTFKNSKPGNTKKSDAIVGQYQTPTYEKSSLDLLEKPNRTKVFKKPSKSKKSSESFCGKNFYRVSPNYRLTFFHKNFNSF